MASTYLTRTPSSAGSTTKGTFSFWIKKSAIASDMYLWTNYANSTNWSAIGLNNSDQLYFYAESSGSAVANLKTNKLFRDTSAWYHIVVALDSTDGTADDRIKIYVNGVQETSFAQRTNPSSSGDLGISETVPMEIGRYGAGSAYFNGSMANIEFVDGTALTPAYFGSTDSNTGIWTSQATSTISDYGTNGYKLKMDTTTPGADTSGKSNTFTASGTPTLTQGSPSNNWCTWTPLAKYNRSATFANGNTTVNSNNNSLWDSARGAFGFQKGKWYWETKFFGSSAAFNYIGVCNENAIMGTNDAYDKNAVTVFYNSDGGEMRKDGSATSANYGTFSTSDVCGVAVDADNNTISIYKNNSIIVTNYALSTYANQLNGTGFIFPNAAVLDNGSGQYTNFGEGFFGTVAAGTAADGNGQGLFAYAPPTSYYAMNTKNLEAYG